jgi:triosephosphate isomerase
MNQKIVIANWKMNPASLKLAEKLIFDLVKNLKAVRSKVKIVVCPPFLYLEKLRKISQKIFFGAQDVFWEGKGAYTGEISAPMLYGIGARYVILGHSEKRSMGEDNYSISRKMKASLSAKLTPILCVGEISRDPNHEYLNFIETQIKKAFLEIPKISFKKVIIAYEPVWAISTTLPRQDATSADSLEMAIFIRKIISDLSTPQIAASVPVIYGGSIDKKNAFDFLKNGGVDGVLVGGASLNSKNFWKIVGICKALKN